LFKLLKSIFYNRGMESIAVNQAYNSIICWVKYVKMYVLGRDEAGGLVRDRRGMRLCKNIAGSLTALLR
jgi:hypothetical protein